MNGSCRCGNIGFAWEYAGDTGALRPRACRCDFCSARNATYISVPGSSLSYWIRDESQLRIEKHGTGTAAFHVCAGCGDLVLVTSAIEGRLYAVLNSATIRDAAFGAPAPMVFSEESLATKLARRQNNWIADVTRRSL